MWVPSTWETEADILTDLVNMAEYGPDEDEKTAGPPTTVLKHRQQMEANRQKTLHSDIDENATIIVSGRGRGIHDRLIRPGGTIDCHPSDETELKKQIRQVAGFGYSNQLIEQSIQAKLYDPSPSTSNPAFKLTPQTFSAGSSTQNSPTKKKSSTTTEDAAFVVKNEEFPILK